MRSNPLGPHPQQIRSRIDKDSSERPRIEEWHCPAGGRGEMADRWWEAVPTSPAGRVGIGASGAVIAYNDPRRRGSRFRAIGKGMKVQLEG